MASIGGKRSLVGSGGAPVADLLAADLKAAQRPAGIVVPPSSYNDSMYGAPGPWRVDERGPVTVKLPAFKFSIRSARGITVTVKAPAIKIFSTAGVLHSHAMSYRSNYYKIGNEIVHRADRVSAFSAEWEKLEDDIERIAGAFNYDKSDLQSDYFDVGFYFDVRLDPSLAAGNQALAERTISALEVAFPDTWERMVAEATNEEAFEMSRRTEPGYFADENRVGSTRRNLLEMSARRALEAVSAGTFSIPFDIKKRNWGTSRRGNYARERKLKVGLVHGVIGPPGLSIEGVQRLAPGSHEWAVHKLTGGRGGKYTDRALVERGVAESLEGAVNAADAAMGFAPGVD